MREFYDKHIRTLPEDCLYAVIGKVPGPREEKPNRKYTSMIALSATNPINWTQRWAPLSSRHFNMYMWRQMLLDSSCYIHSTHPLLVVWDYGVLNGTAMQGMRRLKELLCSWVLSLSVLQCSNVYSAWHNYAPHGGS